MSDPAESSSHSQTKNDSQVAQPQPQAPPADDAPAQGPPARPVTPENKKITRVLPQTVLRYTSGQGMGNSEDQRHVTMDAHFAAELEGRVLLAEPLFYERYLEFPLEGIDDDAIVKMVTSNAQIIAQLQVIENKCGNSETTIYVDLARLLNDIIDVKANVKHRPPTSSHSPLPQSASRWKHFFVDFHNYRPKDLKVRRYTDLAMVYSHPDNDTAPFSYSDVSCPIEIKKKGNSEAVEGEIADQIRAFFAEQPDRNFILSLTIQFPRFRVWRWDRSGAVASLAMNIFKEFKTFVWLIHRLAQMGRTELGYDSTFQFAGKALRADGQFNMRIVDPTRGVFDIVAEELLWSTKSLFGRATRCWKVRITNNPLLTGYYILKQSFVDATRKLTEDDVYAGIENHVKAGVASRIAYERGSTVSSLRKGLGIEAEYDGKKRRWHTFEDRVCVRMLLSPIGRRVEEFETLTELFGAIRGCVAAHKAILECPGRFLHRDISLNNVMLPPTPSKIKGQRGFLIDFDYAKSLPPLIPIDEKGQPSSEQQPSLSLKDSMASINSFTVIPEKHHDRTGTKPWMAISILNRTERHNFKHDLESFFWVLYYLLVLPTSLEQDEVYRAGARSDLNGMLTGDYVTVASFKHAILTKKALWINPIYSVVASHMESLRRLFGVEIMRTVYPEMVLPDLPELTYKSFLDVIDKALHDLGGGGGDVSRVPPLRLEELESKGTLNASTGIPRTHSVSSPPSASAHSSDPGQSSLSSGSQQSCGEKRGREDDPVSNVKRPKMGGKD